MTGYGTPRPIDATDDSSNFDSGEPLLDDYLRKRALANHAGGASRCFVTVHDDRIAGFYALAAGSVYHRDAVGRVRRNMPDPVPVILLSRLAVDRRDQGVGLGRQLLRDAVLRSIEVSEIIGVRAIIVHAKSEVARGFYSRFDFEPSPTDPSHLLLLLQDARALVGR